ncbi:MAG TPA: hypothetical protein VHT25_02270 [Solirubrobacteraceae bacterium]|jgi:hypothetical protein|nr:hypothetical protein [Solirubrobacteraceae bacterium]
MTAWRRRSLLAALAAVLLASAVASALFAAAAPAEFPLYGTGSAGEPASWKLAPGQLPSNIGGLAWKFAATPATPSASNPVEAAQVTKNNSQTDAMAPTFTIADKATVGKQVPEAFEGQSKDTLVTAITGGSSEQTGLTVTLALSNEEALEIKAKTRAGK